jgi:hypothetical protein
MSFQMKNQEESLGRKYLINKLILYSIINWEINDDFTSL